MLQQRLLPQIRAHLLLALAGGILLYLSFEHYRVAEADARAALERLETSRRQAAQIQQIGDRPAFAATAIEDVGSLTDRITRARAAAEIAETTLDLVDPRSPARMGDSSYLLRPVVIELRGLLLPQVVRFTAALTNVEDGMWVNALRLAPVRRGEVKDKPELWNVDLTLTQLIFSPTTP